MSRFGKLFQTPSEPDNENLNSQVTKSPSTQNSKIVTTQIPTQGRPKGKRSNPDYEQVTAYIKKVTYRKVKMALLEKEEGDFSDLVQKLLEEWISQKL